MLNKVKRTKNGQQDEQKKKHWTKSSLAQITKAEYDMNMRTYSALKSMDREKNQHNSQMNSFECCFFFFPIHFFFHSMIFVRIGI